MRAFALPKALMSGSRSTASLWILAGVFALIASLAYGVYATASRIDLDSSIREEQLVSNGMEREAAALRREVSSESVWADAVQHLDNHFDPKWATQHIGHYFWDTDGYQLIYVLDATGSPMFGFERGRVVGTQGFGPLVAAAKPLIQGIRVREAARGPFKPGDTTTPADIDSSTIARRGEETYVLAASLVQTDHGSNAMPSARAPIIVVGEAVGDAFITKMKRQYLLDDLRIVPPGHAVPRGYDSSPFAISASSLVFHLAWKRNSPISHLVGTAGPPLAAVFLALALTPILVILNERRTRALVLATRDAHLASSAKTAFLATMSHEIRTPLNGILGMAQAVLNDDLPATQRQRIEVVRSCGQTLLAIINDILDLSKIEAGKLELEMAPFDIAEVLEGARTAFTALASDKSLGFDLRVDERALGLYDGDVLRIRQILLNLISNAVKFTDHGEVRVAVECAEAGIRIVVADTGAGIAPDQVGKLFQRFVQEDSSTTRRFGGTGLGLAICRELCMAMGGSIDVQSAPGEGSTFTVLLPLPRSAAVAVAAAPKAMDGRVHDDRPLRVLAAEDNVINQLVLKTFLAQLGIEPTVVGDGAAALEAWEGGDWDLILMDVQMPVMDGMTASKRIRSLEAQTGRPRTTIVALTANVMSHQIKEYGAAGMDGCVPKPIEAAVLFTAIETALSAPSPRTTVAA